MSAAPAQVIDRTKFLGGMQSQRVPSLNEGVVRHLYTGGMTIAEIAIDLRTSARSVWLFMVRAGISRRIAAKRDQRGPSNSNWKGSVISYKGAHQRVQAVRGKSAFCEDCGTTDANAQYEWANLTGRYDDPSDYKRLCRSCHCKFDRLIRNLGAYAKAGRR